MSELIDTINDELDSATLTPFQTFEQAWTAIAFVLEAHGVDVPQASAEDELLFHLTFEGEEGGPYYLYVATDRVSPEGDDEGDAEAGNDWTVYATVCNQEDLETLEALDELEDETATGEATPPEQVTGDTMQDIWKGVHHLRTRKAG